MLYIDPNLHNPKVNGVPLIVNNRINPDIAINRDDIVAGDGVVIDRYPDGSIKISANVNGIITGDSDKYLDVWDIDFMSSLPSVLFKYLVTLFDGLGVDVFFVRDYKVAKNRTSIYPGTSCSFDVNGIQKQYEQDVYLGQTICSVELLDNSNEIGQGLYITFEENPRICHHVKIYRGNSIDENNVLIESNVCLNYYFKSFDNFASGDYLWIVTDIDRYTFDKREPVQGVVSFEWEQSPYPYDASPTNMTSNENSEWIVSGSSVYSGQEVFNVFNNDDNVFHTNSSYEHWVSWRNKNKKVKIGRISITSSDDSYWSSSLSSLRFEGSDDGQTWTEISILNAEYGSATKNEFLIQNSRPYYYHRLYSLSPSSYMTIKFIKATRE